MQPSSATPTAASPVEADNIPGIICQLRALEAAVDDKEAAADSASEANGPGKMSRGHRALRLACALAALLPLWAGWVVFSYFYSQSTLWPLPRTMSDTVADIALVASVALVVLVPLLTTLALLHAARTRTLLAFTLVFLAAMLLTLAPVFAIYGALRAHPYSASCTTDVTAYLSSGTLQLFTGAQVATYDYAEPARGPSGDLDFLLEPSSSSDATPIRFVYDPERHVAGLSSGGYTVAFPEGAFVKGEGHERFTLRADRGRGAVVLQSLGRRGGTLKVCAEPGERALVAMAVASWVYTREY